MKKFRIPPILLLTNPPAQIVITHFEFDPLTQSLIVTFPIGSAETGARQKASVVQKLVTEYNSNVTARCKDGSLHCNFPNLDIDSFLLWLKKHTPPDSWDLSKKCLTALLFDDESALAEIENLTKAKCPKPAKGVYSTDIMIDTLGQGGGIHQTANAVKHRTQAEYVFKEEIIAELEAFHGELCRLIMSPTFAPKVRSVHDPISSKPIGVLSKKVKQFLSLFDLYETHKKILSVDELLAIGFARLIAYAYAAEENDLHTDNYGINQPPDGQNNLKPGTHIERLDPGYSSYTLYNCACKIYGLKPIDRPRLSRAFGRSVRPEDAFPIDPRDIKALPNMHVATPINWPYHVDRNYSNQLFFEEQVEKHATINVDQLNKDPRFKRELYQHFLKIILINEVMLENLGKAFISESEILVEKYGPQFVKTISPDFLDTEEFKKNSDNEEYKKAVLRCLYVNHYNARFAQLRETLLNMPEFREYFIQYDESYINAILREFQEYNDQFCSKEKTAKDDCVLLERYDGCDVKVSYKKKHLDHLVKFDKINQDFKAIREEVLSRQKTYDKEFINNLESYINIHPWDVGFQIVKKVIRNNQGHEKAVPSCVYEQKEEILKFRNGNQTAEKTVARIMEIGEQAYQKSLAKKANSSADSIKYYSLFKDKNAENVMLAIAPFIKKNIDDDFVNLCV